MLCHLSKANVRVKENKPNKCSRYVVISDMWSINRAEEKKGNILLTSTHTENNYVVSSM